MALIKEYLLKILERCSDQQFGQLAVEHGIITGRVPLTYKLEADVAAIMGTPNVCPDCHFLNLPAETKCEECDRQLQPAPGLYDELCAEYRRHVASKLENYQKPVDTLPVPVQTLPTSMAPWPSARTARGELIKEAA